MGRGAHSLLGHAQDSRPLVACPGGEKLRQSGPEGRNSASLDLRTAPARGCTDSFFRRAGSAEGLIAACGMPGDLWPLVACPPSAPAGQAALDHPRDEPGRRETSEATPPLWYQEGFCPLALDLRTAPAWQGCSGSPQGRTRSAEGLTAACGLPGTHGRLWPAPSCAYTY